MDLNFIISVLIFQYEFGYLLELNKWFEISLIYIGVLNFHLIHNDCLIDFYSHFNAHYRIRNIILKTVSKTNKKRRQFSPNYIKTYLSNIVQICHLQYVLFAKKTVSSKMMKLSRLQNYLNKMYSHKKENYVNYF